MTRVYVFLAVFLFNAYKGLFTATSLDTPIRVLTLLGDVLIIGMALSVFRRNLRFYGLRYLLFLLFASTLTLLTSLEQVGVSTHLSVVREFMFFPASLVVVHDILRSEWEKEFKRYFTFLLLIFCAAQIPVSYMQFLEYGAGDRVGGTLGFFGQGVLTQLLFALSFYFIVIYGSSEGGDEFSLKKIFLFCIVLLPCAITETKIAFLYLLLFFGLLTFTRKVHKLVPMAFLGVGIIVLFIAAYSEYVQSVDNLLDEKFLERYLVHDERQKVDMPRGQKLTMTLDKMSQEPVTYLLGFGYGSIGSRSLLETSSFSQSVWWIRGARTFLNTVWFQGGLALVFVLALPMFSFVRSQRVVTGNMKRFRFFLFFLLLSVWLYNDALTYRTFSGIMAYLIVWTDLGGTDQDIEEDTADDEHVWADEETATG